MVGNLRARNDSETFRVRELSYEDYQKDTPRGFELSSLPVSTRNLKKRVDQPVDIGTLVKDLWDNASKGNKIATGQQGSFTLDPNQSNVFTTGECFGCTVVVLCSGKKVVIIHFKEISGVTNNFQNDAAFLTQVIEPLESVMEANKPTLGQNPIVVIFTPTPMSGGGFIYRSRIEGPNSIEAAIDADFPQPAVTKKIGYKKLQQFDNRFDETAAGKLVVEWKAPNSPCGASGVGDLNIYAEDQWIVEAHFNAAGNPVTKEGTSCTM